MIESTYLQYESPFGFDMHWPPFLHGDGAHDVNPEMIEKKIKKLLNVDHFIVCANSPIFQIKKQWPANWYAISFVNSVVFHSFTIWFERCECLCYVYIMSQCKICMVNGRKTCEGSSFEWYSVDGRFDEGSFFCGGRKWRAIAFYTTHLLIWSNLYKNNVHFVKSQDESRRKNRTNPNEIDTFRFISSLAGKLHLKE